MLLAEHQGRWPRRVPSYGKLWKDLKANVAPAKKGQPKDGGMGAYPEDVERVLIGLKIPFLQTTDQADPDSLLARVADAPIMVGMEGKAYGASGHWIVLVRATPQGIEFYDPLLKHVKRKTLPIPRFGSEWDGSSFQLTPPK